MPTSRVAVVTGAASGIGLATALKLADQGIIVHIADVSETALAAVLDAHPALSGSVADVGDYADVERLFRDAVAKRGPIDILVNNAGVGGPRAAIEDIEVTDWCRTINVNVNSAFFCIKQVIGGMKARGHGVIVNISSSSARTGLPDRTPYVTAKQAMIGLTLNVAREAGPFGVRCNSVLPGIIHNARGMDLIRARAAADGVSLDDAKTKFLRYVSLRTMIEPEDVGDTVAYLASDAARFVTGQHIGVCGNMEWEE